MKSVKFISGLFLVTSLLFFASCNKEEDSKPYTSVDIEILQLVNQHRKSLAKPELIMDLTIWEEAMKHSKNMADGNVTLSHAGFTDRVARITAIIGGGAAAENVAYNFSSARDVVDGWLKSSGHKANIEGDYTLTGVSAVKSSSGSWYYTQLFLKK